MAIKGDRPLKISMSSRRSEPSSSSPAFLRHDGTSFSTSATSPSERRPRAPVSLAPGAKAASRAELADIVSALVFLRSSLCSCSSSSESKSYSGRGGDLADSGAGGSEVSEVDDKLADSWLRAALVRLRDRPANDAESSCVSGEVGYSSVVAMAIARGG
eukprot:CAMPEP_0198336636 /NCGR_PEP_ID=MMETSP1450-20131203/21101_1 /TAXON_ID=753684 ORGANISM="Madagascaria erythrocladiodes, Strain CCMP3234" /NCGR_SAMPLE_ID=MMETSP1450 /ASSEMBLY_ACC=CAM_ASM_001115 /LENGTH=158 /DNA_ID=CAMNT_0044041391 /DNA_START=355 /DNA_END=831 /DNA_ORIENTATION=-